MKVKLLIATIASIAAVTAHATLITDAVENDGSWTKIDNGGFSTGRDGLVPVEGDSFFYYGTTGTRNAGTWKLFSETFTAETLKVTYSLGEFTDINNPWTWTGAISPLLFADTNEDGLYTWSERILSTTQVSHTAPSNGWEQWEDRYEINASTQTVNGDFVIGEQVGFFVYSPVGSYENFTFDSLQIETIPEPATLGLLGFSVLALMGIRRIGT